MNKSKTAIVIGSGFGGLACACYLAKAGFEVTIYEKNPLIGGRANLLKAKNYLFDMGPSWYTMPEVFERFFKDFGKQTSDYYKLVKLRPLYKFFFPDLTNLTITGQIGTDQKSYESIEPGSAKRVEEYRRVGAFQYQVSMQEFIYKQFSSWREFLTRRMLIDGPRLHVFENMDQYIKRFFKTEKMHQIMMYSLVFLGGGPKNTPAIYSLMSHVDYTLGIFYPMGGIYQVVKGLGNLAKELGVQIKTNSEVSRIVVKDGLAVGVKIRGKLITADVVVSNADYAFTELKMLDDASRSYDQKYWQKKQVSPSGFIIYLGIKTRLRNLDHHNVVFGEDWMDHFEQIFDRPAWPDKPSYYVCAPAKTDPSVAPKSSENVFILVPIAPDLRASDSFKKAYAQKIIGDLEDRIDQKFSQMIEFQQIFSVEDFESMYHAYKGNGLAGLVHTLRQTAIFRPTNRSKKVGNLYYTGAYTLPGIGMPICLISGQLTAERIIKEQL